ncbi:DUF4383 domain-containing protein [Kocuria aegyptia]|uniref:DUF4383 domain-containing protein n=1 Tax=Kocuria aegyptia TaxID=330943 RepID=A0ABP4WLH1_9MICC
MDLQLCVHVRVDPDHRRVRLITTGRLTETNQQVLYPLIHQARALASDTEVVIDLTSVDRLEGAALDLLCWEVEHDGTGSPTRPVRLALAEPLSTGRFPGPPEGKVRRTGSTAWTPPDSGPSHQIFPAPAGEASRTGSTAWAPPGPAPATRFFSGDQRGRRLLAPCAPPTKGWTMTTAAARSTYRSPVETATLGYVTVFLLFGLAGFIPGLTTDYASLELAGHHSEAMLLGLFQVSILHNALHLLYGVAGAAMARSAAGARTYLRWGGAVYLVLWIHGLIVHQQSPVNVVPLNTADDWLHLFFGATMVGLSFLGREPARAGHTGRAS